MCSQLGVGSEWAANYANAAWTEFAAFRLPAAWAERAEWAEFAAFREPAAWRANDAPLEE